MLCAAALFSQTAVAQEIRPFVRGSMKQIVAAHHNQPFILGLWSLTCAHCQEELATLGKISAKFPGLKLVLVSTDNPEEKGAIAATLGERSLQQAEAWVFADDFAERLRFEVDKKWRGELPRTYVYDAGGSAKGMSGALDPAQLERWAQEHSAPR